MEPAELELTNFIGTILDNPALEEFFPEIVVKCEVKPDEDIYKDIHITSNCQDIYYAHFLKPGILFRSFQFLKLLTRNHYKNIRRAEFVKNSPMKR